MGVRYGGRQKAFKTAEEFGEAIESFIDYVEDKKAEDTSVIPADYLLLKYFRDALGVKLAIQTLYDYRANKENRYNGYAEEYKKIEQYREYFYQSMAAGNPKLTGFSAFALKQGSNGGWTDRQTVEVPEIKIKIEGGGDLHDIGQ